MSVHRVRTHVVQFEIRHESMEHLNKAVAERLAEMSIEPEAVLELAMSSTYEDYDFPPWTTAVEAKLLGSQG